MVILISPIILKLTYIPITLGSIRSSQIYCDSYVICWFSFSLNFSSWNAGYMKPLAFTLKQGRLDSNPLS